MNYNCQNFTANTLKSLNQKYNKKDNQVLEGNAKLIKNRESFIHKTFLAVLTNKKS